MESPRVLVVDDSPSLLRSVEGVLAGAGYRVRTAPDGPQGLAAMRAERPDLVLLDFVMPGMGGEQVCRLMHTDPALATIPVVLMTTKGDGAAERVVQQMGVADYITKPFSPDAILALASYTLEKFSSPVPSAPTEHVSDEQTLIQPLSAFLGALDEQPAGDPEATEPPPAEEGVRRALVRNLSHRLKDVSHPRIHDVITEAVEEALGQLPPLSGALQVDPGRPALWGDFSLVPIPEVFQLMTLQGQTGLFQVWPDARLPLGGVAGTTRFDVYFSNGRVDFVQATQMHEEFLLGRFLVASGAIDKAELDSLLRARKGHKKLLGQQLVALGHVTRDQLNHALRDQCCELVFELLRFQRGTFCLRKDVPPPGDIGDTRLAIPVDELLLEGLRRVDEWGLVEKHIPHFDVRFELDRRSTEKLSEEERYVLGHVSPEMTVRQLIARCGMRPFDVCKILYRLLMARQIRALP